MPRNGSGSYSLPQPPFVANTTISSSAVNSDLSDIATALTASVSADGQTVISGLLRSSITTGPAFGSSIDTTSGVGVSAAGEVDLWSNNTKILVITSLAGTLNGNFVVTGTGAITGATTLGTVTITTANTTTSNVTTETITGILTDNNNGYWVPPHGTTGQRPGGPSAGWERFNTSTNQMEYWNGTSWQTLAGIFAPDIQIFTSGVAQTYTTATQGGNLPLYLRVRMVGGGGGGGASQANAGTGGNTTSFASWTALGGSGGSTNPVSGTGGGAGGTGGANSTGTQITRVGGGGGGGGATNQTSGNYASGVGGSSFFGGGAASVYKTSDGIAGATNSGAGGSGGADNNTHFGAGGGAGEFVEFIITSPAASYTYTVGTGGNGGAAGGNNAGGAGAAGRIEVIGYWQ